jgi:hypothetical protein
MIQQLPFYSILFGLPLTWFGTLCFGAALALGSTSNNVYSDSTNYLFIFFVLVQHPHLVQHHITFLLNQTLFHLSTLLLAFFAGMTLHCMTCDGSEQCGHCSCTCALCETSTISCKCQRCAFFGFCGCKCFCCLSKCCHTCCVEKCQWKEDILRRAARIAGCQLRKHRKPNVVRASSRVL